MSDVKDLPTSTFLAGEQPLYDEMATAAEDVRAWYAEGARFEQGAEDEDYRRIGLEVVGEQQAEAFTRLLSASERMDLEELLRRAGLNANWLERLAQERLEINAGHFAEAEAIREEAERYVELLPAAADRFLAEAEERVSRKIPERLMKLGYQEQAAQSIAMKLGRTLEIAGQMPVNPKFVPPERRTAIYDSVHGTGAGKTDDAREPVDMGDETYEADIFPTDPRTLTNRQVAELVRRNYPELVRRDASAFLALILAEDPGRAYTNIELGQIMYPDEDIAVAANRVNSLVNNIGTNSVRVIPMTLAEQHMPPLFLQVGERVRYKIGTTERKGHARRVYRAVASADEPVRTLVSPDQADLNWRTIETPVKETDD